jgi:hypothetical protein
VKKIRRRKRMIKKKKLIWRIQRFKRRKKFTKQEIKNRIIKWLLENLS